MTGTVTSIPNHCDNQIKWCFLPDGRTGPVECRMAESKARSSPLFTKGHRLEIAGNHVSVSPWDSTTKVTEPFIVERIAFIAPA